MSSARPGWLWTASFVGLLAAGWIFRDGLWLMTQWWSREEYSHSWMIPFVAGLLVWQRLPSVPGEAAAGRWIGLLVVLASIAAWPLGELSALYTILQYGFLLGLYGLALSLVGWARFKRLAAPLLYLLFMVPLPNFLYFNLSQQLQLLSSSIGVFFVRLLDISVHLEGNVIDLGVYKLQVVEACSGLNYLFPLMSFGFLLGYLYRGAFWQRTLLFLMSIPITVLMNSFRIGVIGVLVDRYGIEQAEGFLHYFEGWVIFLACVALLLLMIAIFNVFRAGRPSVLSSLDLDFPGWTQVKPAIDAIGRGPVAPIAASALALLLLLPVSTSLAERKEVAPVREAFVRFPMIHLDWVGRQGHIDADTLGSLRLSDHVIADYQAATEAAPVNLYVSWYDSQRKGASVHSPRACIPGGGWEIAQLEQVAIPGVARGLGNLQVNRVLIRRGDDRQIVYYWFEQRGRSLTNEYLVKWYIFQDSLLLNRSDGAMVRVTTPVPDGASIEEADARLRRFIAEFDTLLGAYVPR